MCFSAGASFTASIVLGGAGAVTWRHPHARKIWAFASVPFIFAIHQFSEGLLWLSFDHEGLQFLRKPSIYAYIVFSQIIWPFWAPFALWQAETDQKRKKILSYFTVLGVVTSMYLFYTVLTVSVNATVGSHHIQYQVDFIMPQLRRILYFLTTVVTLFIATNNHIRYFGLALLITLILSFLIYTNYVISVWCFFAAIISAVIPLIVARDARRTVMAHAE